MLLVIRKDEPFVNVKIIVPDYNNVAFVYN